MRPPTQSSAHQPQQQILCQHLPDEPRSSRADRRPDRKLPLPSSGARQQHVGNIRACNQQHQPNQAHQKQQRFLERRYKFVVACFAWRQADVPKISSSLRRELSQKLLKLSIGRGFCLGQSDATLDSRHLLFGGLTQKVHLTELSTRMHPWHPQCRLLPNFKTVESSGRTHDREWKLVEMNGAPDDPLVAPESALPKSVRDFRRPSPLQHVL